MMSTRPPPPICAICRAAVAPFLFAWGGKVMATCGLHRGLGQAWLDEIKSAEPAATRPGRQGSLF